MANIEDFNRLLDNIPALKGEEKRIQTFKCLSILTQIAGPILEKFYKVSYSELTPRGWAGPLTEHIQFHDLFLKFCSIHFEYHSDSRGDHLFDLNNCYFCVDINAESPEEINCISLIGSLTVKKFTLTDVLALE